MTMNADEAGANASVNGEPAKKAVMEKRYFMGDQGVNVWRSGMEIGSIVKDGISESQRLVLSNTS